MVTPLPPQVELVENINFSLELFLLQSTLPSFILATEIISVLGGGGACL